MNTYGIWAKDGELITRVQGTSIECNNAQSVMLVKNGQTIVAILSIANIAAVVQE